MDPQDNRQQYGLQPTPQSTMQPQPAATFSGPSDPVKKSRKGPIIAIIAGVVVALLLIIIAVIAATSDSSQQKPDQQNNSPASSQADLLKAGQAIEIEQINNAINQDLSGLDDEKDLPANNLDDKSLGL